VEFLPLDGLFTGAKEAITPEGFLHVGSIHELHARGEESFTSTRIGPTLRGIETR
jgi:hypothetical protein